MNPVVSTLPAFPGEPFPRTGNPFGSAASNGFSSDQQSAAILQIGTMGFFSQAIYDAFEDFVYEQPFFGEERTSARDVDFGFKSAAHSFVEVNGQKFLRDFAPDWPREQESPIWGPGSGQRGS